MFAKRTETVQNRNRLNGICVVVVPIEMSISANERNYSGVIRSLIYDTACNILTFQMTHIRLCSKHEEDECDTQRMYTLSV